MTRETLVNLEKAIQFIRNQGDEVDQARLAYIINGIHIDENMVNQFFADQRNDDSWEPFWAEDYGSLDATCFHLSKAIQMGIEFDHPPILKTYQFLASRQKTDGFWEEDESITPIAPPWVMPGDLASRCT